MIINTAIIPAAGYGQRVHRITNGGSKELIIHYNKPLIEHAITECILTGVKRIVVISRDDKHDLNQHLSKLVKKVPNLKVVFENNVSSLGKSIYQASDYFKNSDESHFLVVLPDELLDPETSINLIDDATKYNKSMVLIKQIPEKDLNQYGIVHWNSLTGALDLIIEKPKELKDAPSNYGIIGRYVLSIKLFPLLKTKSLNDSILSLINRGKEVFWVRDYYGPRIDGGSLKTYGWEK